MIACLDKPISWNMAVMLHDVIIVFVIVAFLGRTDEPAIHVR